MFDGMTTGGRFVGLCGREPVTTMPRLTECAGRTPPMLDLIADSITEFVTDATK